MTSINRLELLKSYVECGLSLVPIPLGAKCPKQKGWNRREATISAAEAVTSITGNVGLAHAYCTPSPTAALDLDDVAAAATWFTSRGIDLRGLLDADDAVTINSGRKNRGKLLYRLPLSVAPLATAQHQDPQTSRMVFELRCAAKNGSTMQDVLPPSIHPDTGEPYRWGGKGHYTRLPEIPQQLLLIWHGLTSGPRASHKPQKSTPFPDLGEIPDYVKGLDEVTLPLLREPETPRAVASAREMLSFIDADCPYPKYRDIVWAITSTGWSCAYDLAYDWSTSAPHRFDESVLQALFESYSYSGGIRFGTLIHHAREGGWHG